MDSPPPFVPDHAAPPSYSAATTSVPLPPPPRPIVDPYTLPAVLSRRLLDEVLLPHCPEDGRLGAFPPWTQQLEQWVQAIHEDAWSVICKDHKADRLYLEMARRRLGLHDVPGGAVSTADLRGKDWQQGVEFHDEVCHRVRARYHRIFALRFVRARWAHGQLRQTPGAPLEELFKRAPQGSYGPLPSFDAGTVWPLPTTPPPGAVSAEGFVVPFCETTPSSASATRVLDRQPAPPV
ncbi:hypothetical protein JCM10213v2_003057 [Rhodosporidiobolus nylandii]